jgi:putative phage-type endonuclease
MSTTIIRPKDRNEWLDYRRAGIGSSEIATIVGLNPYETPYQLWRRKIGLDEPKSETFAMKAGHYLEDAVSQFWSDATGRQIIKASAGDWIVRNDEKPFVQVSPDRTYWLDDNRSNDNKGILECKTTQRAIDADDLPKTWFCQVQYQLGGAEIQQGSIAWLTAGREFGYQDLTLVPDFYAWLVEEAERFWIDNVMGGKEPDCANVQDVLIKFNRHTDSKVIEVGDEIMQAYNQLKDVRAEISKLEEQKEALEAKLKMGFGDAEAISYGGNTLATWKAGKDSEKFDAKAFQADHPELAKQYTKSVKSSRRFLLK